ncbi:MAG: TonB-dependent receptor plug domain-containing protein, partial [Zavarzinia sp.]|nr:TonB-dependent receptor plug domain-containing protein [Zavarzinia sp.]
MPRSLSRTTSLFALLAATTPVAALAEEPVQLPTVVVEGRADATDATVSADEIREAGVPSPDSARLLAGQPGVSLKTGGAISSLPVLNGLADDRVRILLDGMSVTAACPNHMNPALSYIEPGRIESIEAIAGVTPVSLGGDSLGGTIVVEPTAPRFAPTGEELVTGRVSTFYRSNGDALTVSGDTTVATDRLSVGYAGSWSRTDDYEGGGPNRTVRST